MGSPSTAPGWKRRSWHSPGTRRKEHGRMRLLAAELRKLRRPLMVWSLIAVVVLIGLFAWGSSKQASDQLRFAHLIEPGMPTCEELGLQPGPECDRRLEEIRKNGEQAAA